MPHPEHRPIQLALTVEEAEHLLLVCDDDGSQLARSTVGSVGARIATALEDHAARDVLCAIHLRRGHGDCNK